MSLTNDRMHNGQGCSVSGCTLTTESSEVKAWRLHQQTLKAKKFLKFLSDMTPEKYESMAQQIHAISAQLENFTGDLVVSRPKHRQLDALSGNIDELKQILDPKVE